MRPRTKKQSTGFFGRLLRCERGDQAGPLTGLVMMTLGLAAVSQVVPAVQDSASTAGKALRNQAGVISRGTETGSMNGGSGGSGFDIGQFTGMASQFGGMFGQFAELGEKLGEKFGDAQQQQAASGQVSGDASQMGKVQR